MITSTTATERRGNLRGSSSSSAAVAPPEEKTKEEDINTPVKDIRKDIKYQNLEIQAAEEEYIKTPVKDIIKDIEFKNLEIKAQQHLKHLMIAIKHNVKHGITTDKADNILQDSFDIKKMLLEINKYKPGKYKKL